MNLSRGKRCWSAALHFKQESLCNIQEYAAEWGASSWGKLQRDKRDCSTLIDLQPFNYANRLTFCVFVRVKVTLCASLSLQPCMLRIRYPSITSQKTQSSCEEAKMTLCLLSNYADLTLHNTAAKRWIRCIRWPICSTHSACLDLFMSWLGECECVCACKEREKGELYQVADMFSLCWAPVAANNSRCCLSLLTWSVSLQWVGARPSQYLFSTNTAPAQRHIVRSFFN